MSQVRLIQRSDGIGNDGVKSNDMKVSMQPAAPPLKRVKSAAQYRCLIVSGSQTRGTMFGRAAVTQGWEPIVCSDIEDATRAAVCEQFQMAIIDVDVDNNAKPGGFRQLVEQIASVRNRLVMVCGNEEDAAEEIWARQLGVWMYLPGVDDASDVAMLCGESKNVVEKLHFPSATSKRGKPVSRNQTRNHPR